MAKCEHLKQANPDVLPSDQGCTECLQSGQRWVQLRRCLVCGHVGCCDSSPGQHATQHFRETGHVRAAAVRALRWKRLLALSL